MMSSAQKSTRELLSPIAGAPRQLDPIVHSHSNHRPSTSGADVFSPIQALQREPSRRESRRISTVSRGSVISIASPSKRQSVVQRRDSNLRRSSTHPTLATVPGKSKRRISPGRRSTISRHSNNGEYRDEDGENLDDKDEPDDFSDDDGDDGRENDNLYESRRAERLYRETQATSLYRDGSKVFRGVVDRRGITPFVTFSTTETPPSQSNNPMLLDRKQVPPTCGFCSSNNLIWTLHCSFCGCSRMSDAPRLKYLIDMVLSTNPTITGQELSKRVLDFAKFDHVAMKIEEKFKQASLVRAKAAIMMMSRTIHALRMQTMRMIFSAWKGNNAIQASHDRIMHRLIKIKDIQLKSKSKNLVFSMWKGYVERVVEERSQRYAIASKRNDITRARRVWGAWQQFMRMRAREKLKEMKEKHDAERREAPNAFVKEIEKLQEALAESRRLVFAATNTMFDLLHQSTRFADEDVQRVLQLKQMYPSTAGVFFESVYGHHILDGLANGHVSTSEDFSTDDATMEELMAKGLDDARVKIDTMHSSESLIQWLNFQRKRATTMTYEAITSAASSATTAPSTEANATSSSPTKRPSLKLKQAKKKDVKEIKGLQDLRTSIASPNVMLKLLCHSSSDARTEYRRYRATENATAAAASVTAENSTTSTALTPAAQVQLRAYFKMVTRFLKLPPDVLTRDAFVLNDFDALYAFAVYLFTFHPNVVAPGLALSPRYRLSFGFFTPQWHKIQHKLTEDVFDPFAQQQFYIFLAKVKRVSKQFMRLESICRHVDQIATWHQLATLKDTYNDLTRRALGKDSNISVSLEKETMASWVSLPAAKLLNLCENEDELKAIEQVFKDNVLDLIKIFRVYGSGSGGKGILEQEFLKVMTKAGVTTNKNMLRSNLQVIYQQSRLQPSLPGGQTSLLSASISSDATASPPPATLSGNNDEGDDDTMNEDRGATPNEFFEALVRVAYHGAQKKKQDPGLFAVTPATPLPSPLLPLVVDLVVDKVVPLTKKFQEQGLMFKKQMVNPEVQLVCKAQERRLKRVFLTYSQKNKNPGSRGKLMDLQDFETLLKDKRLVDALFPHGKIKQLVAFVQQDGDLPSIGGGGGGGYDSDTEFVFAEFVEALAAIAVFRNANPYLPLAKKLEVFFEENF